MSYVFALYGKYSRAEILFVLCFLEKFTSYLLNKLRLVEFKSIRSFSDIFVIYRNPTELRSVFDSVPHIVL